MEVGLNWVGPFEVGVELVQVGFMLGGGGVGSGVWEWDGSGGGRRQGLRGGGGLCKGAKGQTLGGNGGRKNLMI